MLCHKILIGYHFHRSITIGIFCANKWENLMRLLDYKMTLSSLINVKNNIWRVFSIQYIPYLTFYMLFDNLISLMMQISLSLSLTLSLFLDVFSLQWDLMKANRTFHVTAINAINLKRNIIIYVTVSINPITFLICFNVTLIFESHLKRSTWPLSFKYYRICMLFSNLYVHFCLFHQS